MGFGDASSMGVVQMIGAQAVFQGATAIIKYQPGLILNLETAGNYHCIFYLSVPAVA